MLRFFYFSVLCLLVSCANPKKLHKIMDKLPDASAKECATRYPIKETMDTITITDSALLKQYEIEIEQMVKTIDSLLIENCDTMYIDRIKEVIKKIPCKPETKVIVKTQENTAKVAALQAECDKKQSELVTNLNKTVTEFHALKDKNAKLQIRNIWLWVIIILLTLFSFRRQIFNLIK